jgi:hypothetical protein
MYAISVSLDLTHVVKHEMAVYSQVVARFRLGSGVTDSGAQDNIYDGYRKFDFDYGLGRLRLRPALPRDSRFNWDSFPWHLRPTFDGLYHILCQSFWERVVDGIDPALTAIFPFHSIPAAWRFPPTIDQWFIIVLRRFMLSFDRLERTVGMPPVPPSIAFGSDKFTQQSLLKYFKVK